MSTYAKPPRLSRKAMDTVGFILRLSTVAKTMLVPYAVEVGRDFHGVHPWRRELRAGELQIQPHERISLTSTSTPTSTMRATHISRIAVAGLLSLFSLRAVAVVPGASQQQPIQVTDQDEGPFNAQFDMFVNLMMQLFHVPGLSIAVVDDGKTFSKVPLNALRADFLRYRVLLIQSGLRLCRSVSLCTKCYRRHAILHRQHHQSLHRGRCSDASP